MSTTTRETSNALAFLETIVQSGGFTLRPPGYFTVNAMRTLRMKLGQGKEACATLTESQMKDQVHAYLFIQAAPVSDVSRAIRAFERMMSPRTPDTPAATEDDAWDEFMASFVDPFLAQLPPDGIAAAYEQFAQLEEADAAMVEASPPPDFRQEREDPK